MKERTPIGGRGWEPIAALSTLEERIGRWFEQSGSAALYEFVRFGMKQAWACLFGGSLLALIVASRLFYPRAAPLPRYDALVVACVAVQAVLFGLRLELPAEAVIILIFHAVGTAMEVFKTSVGSWTYPEPSILRIGGVPLFSGFMYAAVGSYMARVWRLFDFRFTHHPRLPVLGPLCIAIYLNFFADHWGVDLRWPLVAATVVAFRRTTVFFRAWRAHRAMPLLLGFFLVAAFIYGGENLATAGGAWLYPAQAHGWRPVPLAKLASWFLLMLVSYTLVAGLEGPARIGRGPP